MTDPASNAIPTCAPGEIHRSHRLVVCRLGDLVNEDGEGTLPHGLLESDEPTTFRLNPPTMGTRKRLGALKVNKKLAKRPGEHTAHWLAVALHSLGGRTMLGMKRGAAAALISRLTVGDIMTLLFAWQYMSNPEGLALEAHGCGTCGEAFDKIRVDLATLEVLRLPRAGDEEADDDDEDHQGATLTPAGPGDGPVARLGLRKGLPYPSEENPARTLLLSPPTWSGTFFPLGMGQFANNAVVRAFMIADSIRGVDSCPAVRIPMKAIDELWPVDLTLIDEALGRITPTPLLEIEVACPNCEAINVTDLDWLDPRFFTGSSRG